MVAAGRAVTSDGAGGRASPRRTDRPSHRQPRRLSAVGARDARGQRDPCDSRGIAPRGDVGWLFVRGRAHCRRRQRDTPPRAVAGRIGAGASDVISRDRIAATGRRSRLAARGAAGRVDAGRQPGRAAGAGDDLRDRARRARHAEHSIVAQRRCRP